MRHHPVFRTIGRIVLFAVVLCLALMAVRVLAQTAPITQNYSLDELPVSAYKITVTHEGTIRIYNPLGPTSITPLAVSTPFGDVTIEYSQTPNNLVDPSDPVEVLSVPDGYVAVPQVVSIAEGEWGEIRIIPYAGM